MKSTSRVAAAAATLINPRTVMPLAAIVAASLLATFTQVVKSAGQTASAAASTPAVQASAPARAASAPAVAASTPQPRAPKPAAVTTTATSTDVYYLTPGSSLSAAFGKGWKKVCDASHLRQCGIVRPTDPLSVPADVKIVDGTKLRAKPAAQVAVKRAVSRDASPQATRVVRRAVMREQSCITLGVAPWNPDGDLARTLAGIDQMQSLTPEQKALVKTKVKAGEWTTENELVGTQVFGEMLYAGAHSGKAQSVRGKPLCTPEQGGQPEVMNTIDLGDGVHFSLPRRCKNPSVFTRPIVPQPRQPEPESPPPDQPPPPPDQPTTPPVVAAPRGMCDFVDVAGALGQHHVPRQNGDKASSDFLTFVLDCQQRKEDDTGSWGIGAKLNYSDWHGTAGRGAGRYDGRNYLAQVSYREILDDGRDWGVGVGVGKQREQYHQAALAQQARYNLVGATWVYNDSRRLLAGETFDVKRQYYAGITIPTSSSFTRTIFNQPVDASNMPRLKVGLQAGGRWWIYQPEDLPVAFFVEGGLFWQYPISASANVLGGIADKNHVCGIGPSLDKDLMNGGDFVKALGWWCDPFQGGRIARNEYRKHQFISGLEKAGGAMDRNGMIRLPFQGLQSK